MFQNRKTLALNLDEIMSVLKLGFINTSQRNRGMNIHPLKQPIEASGKKLTFISSYSETQNHSSKWSYRQPPC